ncbi:retinol dehydrogenase 8-like [Diadema antillarum]|uniref:retinol dehydrogenase 8-like n=1 Tax=Diadema antillarum TaxID=105358 RepID=UPI003A895808
MAPQVVLITGCSSGIGLATAIHLARDSDKRFLVYATILGPIEKEVTFREAAGELLNATLFPVEMDVTSDDMVKNAVAMVMTQHGRIDILVNNAGVGVINVSEVASVEVAKKLFDINFFGMLRLTREVLPSMKKRRSGRIINISSNNGIFAFPYLGLYAASKHAIEGFSQEIAIVCRFFNVWVSVIQPGPVNTAMRENIGALGLGSVGEILQNPDIDDVDKRLAEHFQDMHGLAVQPVDVAEVVKEAALAEKPHFRYQTSEHVQEFARKVFVDPTGDSIVDYQAELLEQNAPKC